MTGEELFSWYCNQKRTKGYVPLIKLIDKEMAKQKIDAVKLLDNKIHDLEKYCDKVNHTMNSLKNLPCADCIKFSIKIIQIIDDLKEITAEIIKV